MVELQIASYDGIVYKGEIKDIIKLSMEQRSKLKITAFNMNSSKIEKEGIEQEFEGRKERTIVKGIQEITKYKNNSRMDIIKKRKELIEKKIVIFPEHDQYERIPNPSQIYIQKKISITRLMAVGKITKFNVKVNLKNKQLWQRLVYTTESSIDSGELTISFLQDNHIMILQANISEEEVKSAVFKELSEMTGENNFGYSLEKIECPCSGIASPTFIDVTYKFDGKIIVVKNVPVLKCSVCDEIYDDTLISIHTEQQAYKAMQDNKFEIEF